MLVALPLVAVAGAFASTLLGSAFPAAAAPAPGTATASCPASNPPDELTLAGGSPQTAKLDTAFASPFQVALAASNGCPVTTAVAGTTVTFSAPANGSSTASGAFGASGSSSVTVGTDATGNASAPMFSANDLAGGYTVTASSSYGSVSFSLTNTAAGIAATLAPQAPVSQAAFTAAQYSQPLRLLVLDANGNPVEGATVTFTLGSSGGGAGAGSAGSASAGATFLTGQTQASATTDASGVATSPMFTANTTAGSFSATAATAGVTEPATFKLDNVAGTPPELTLIGDAGRYAPVGSRYGRPLQVKVVDGAGRPVEGAAVTFTLGSGSAGANAAGASSSAGSAGASFLNGSNQATETTGPRGIATSPLFSANATAGSFSATISVSGRTNPLLVTLDNLPAAPPTLKILGGSRGSATVDSRYRHPLEVKVVAQDGKPLEGTTVTFTLGSGSAGANAAGASSSAGSAGASFLNGSNQTTETANQDGVAVSPVFAANGTAGAFSATASLPGVTNPALFELENLAARLSALKSSGAHPRSAAVSGRYRSPLRVTVVGADGKPVEGTSVTFTLGTVGTAGGASGSTGSAGATFVGGSNVATQTTNAAGRAVSPAFSANTVAGSFTATASISGTAALASFPLRNLAGKPATLTAGAAASEQTTVGTRFPIRLAVTVKDKDGNLVAGALVTFTAPAAGATGGFAGAHHADTRTVRVRTDSDGIAVAAPFAASQTTGGYVVTATVKGAAAAAFALVNQPPGL